ncbi:hypothetical protein DRJ17_01485 [Candidatus Woesearchaeota archaeon]|nr:MAG: hypothetical protein DRJ17_01485 [Candidatus Woesearchaeota archaeon]
MQCLLKYKPLRYLTAAIISATVFVHPWTNAKGITYENLKNDIKISRDANRDANFQETQNSRKDYEAIFENNKIDDSNDSKKNSYFGYDLNGVTIDDVDDRSWNIRLTADIDTFDMKDVDVITTNANNLVGLVYDGCRPFPVMGKRTEIMLYFECCYNFDKDSLCLGYVSGNYRKADNAACGGLFSETIFNLNYDVSAEMWSVAHEITIKRYSDGVLRMRYGLTNLNIDSETSLDINFIPYIPLLSDYQILNLVKGKSYFSDHAHGYFFGLNYVWKLSKNVDFTCGLFYKHLSVEGRTTGTLPSEYIHTGVNDVSFSVGVSFDSYALNPFRKKKSRVEVEQSNEASPPEGTDFLEELSEKDEPILEKLIQENAENINVENIDQGAIITPAEKDVIKDVMSVKKEPLPAKEYDLNSECNGYTFSLYWYRFKSYFGDIKEAKAEFDDCAHKTM